MDLEVTSTTPGKALVKKRLVDPVADAWAAHPVADWFVAIALVGAHAVAAAFWPQVPVLGDVPPAQRVLGYIALAGVTALAAGTNNTAVGSYTGASGTVVDSLRTNHGRLLRRNLRDAGGWLWLISIVSVVCVLLDPASKADPTSTRGAAWVFETGLLLGAVIFARITFIQDLVLKANDHSPTAQQPPRQARRRTRRAGQGHHNSD